MPRRTTKSPSKPAEAPPAPAPQRPPSRTPAAIKPTEIIEEELDLGTTAPSPHSSGSGLRGRRTTTAGKTLGGGPSSSGLRRQSSEESSGGDEGSGQSAPKKIKSGGGEQIGNLAMRGMSLKMKLLIFTLIVALPIMGIFAALAVRSLEGQLLDEIKRSGYQQVLGLNAFGQRVMEKFKGVRNGGEFTKVLQDYKATSAADAALIDRIVKGDKRIKDIAIFAAATPEKNPSFAVLRGDPKAENFKEAPDKGLPLNVPNPDPDVLVYSGTYGGEPCLYFRMPIEKADGGKMYSSISLIMAAGEIEAQVKSLKFQLLALGLLLIALGIGASWGVATWFTKPMNMLVEDINVVSQGELDHESQVPNQTSDEVGLLAMAFNRMTRNLRDAREKERDRERLEGELNTAKAIHAKLMPEKLPQLPGIDIFTAYNCAKEVGGDYYDFIPVGDTEHLALCVADVSGKGIPGSMVMGTTRTILRMMAVNNLSAMDVLSKTNFHVARDIKRGMFVTCVYAILNVRTREMTVASAGHNPMLIWRSATNTIEKVRPNGIALGFDKGPVFNRTVREQKVQLKTGDRVVLYTDGVVESMNEAREEWGDDKLDEFTIEHATMPSKEYVRLLIKALEEHQGKAEQHDDITITTFRIV